VADGNNGVTETAGTISAANNSATITGTGTTFTNLSAGDYILVDTVFRLIASITNDTSLELDTTYEGNPLTGRDYVAQTMLGGVVIQNLIITSVAGIKNGMYMRACNRFLIDTVLIQEINNTNIYIENCGDSGLTNVVSMDSTTYGINMTNSHSCILESCAFNNNNNNGVQIEGASQNITLDGCKISINNNNGIEVDGNSSEVSITDSMIMQNDNKGVNVTPGSTSVIINSCTILRNGNHGADFDGSQNSVNDCVISDNGGDGISGGDKGIVVSCHIFNNTGSGISLTGDIDAVVTGNNIRSNGAHGIHSNKQRSIISSNQISNNTSNGIFFELGADESIINDNIIRGNVFGISAVTNDTVISDNIIRDNSDDGVSISGNDNIISGNRIFGNTLKGIDIITGSTDSIVTGNNCKGNTSTSIDDNGTTTALANNKT
jgi:parallel beta-helix repeat protein